MTFLRLLGDMNDEINNWLNENPFYLGLMFLVIGLAVGGWGVFELVKGISYDKRGRAVEGSTGKLLTIIRLVAGAGCILFGLYKIALG